MIPEERKLIRRFLPFLLVGLVALVCYLYFFIDLQEVMALLQRINPLYYSLAVAALALDTFFFSLTWHYLLGPLSVKASFKKTFLFVWAATFVDILVPAESVTGDVSRAYMMTRETGEAESNAGKIAASLVGQRILVTVVVLASLLGSSLSFFILRYEIPEVPVLGIGILTWIFLVTLGTALILLFLFALAFKEEMTRRIIDSLLKVVAFISRGRWQLEVLKFRVQTARDAFHYAIKVLAKHPSNLVWPVVFSLMSWLFSLLVSWLVFVSLLGYPIHFSIVMIVHSLSCAIQSIPLGVPAEVGLTEVAMISLYTAFLRGIPGVADAGALSAAATFLIRLLTVGLRLIIGFAAIQWVGAKVLTGSSLRSLPQDEGER